MPITLKFEQRQHQALDKVEIYRKVGGNTAIDVNNPGTPLATLPGDATSYEDSDIVNNTTYRYWLASVKDDERVFNTPVAQGFYLDTGPGPQKLKFGDWHSGYFGTVPVSEMFTNVELNNLSGASIFSYNAGIYHKFIYKNRILFFPDLAMIYTTPANVYNNNMFYGIEGNGYVPNWASARPQRRTAKKGAYEYVVRLPYLLDYTFANTPVSSPSQAMMLEGEWFNTYARLYKYGGALPRFSDVPVGVNDNNTDAQSATFANMYNINSVWYNRPPYPESMNYGAIGNNNIRMIPVLELVLP